MYALVAALGNVIGALAVTRRAARGLAVIEHFVAFGAGFMLAVALVEVLPEAFTRSGAAAPGLVLSSTHDDNDVQRASVVVEADRVRESRRLH